MANESGGGKGFQVGKMPDPLKYEPQTDAIKDPFQRELLKQLMWMNANMFEMRNNIAMLADWVIAERQRAARAKGQG